MYKLVLVDDEAEIRNGLAQYFPWQQIGFNIVETFDNGLDALNYMESRPVDALLCDISMPLMTGLELVQKLYERGIKTKILLLSAYKNFEYAQQALTYDVKGYILKPTHYNEIYEVFSKLRAELDKEREHRPDSLDQRGYEGTFQDKVIGSIKSYVEHNYSNATLEEAARLIRMNPDYVSKYFKQKTGQNFSDYIVEIRMGKAAELLRDISYKTYEISELVGYSYAKNFTRTFKKYYGVSPREFRNSRESNSESASENE
jgi:two-component system response regulator YesN